MGPDLISYLSEYRQSLFCCPCRPHRILDRPMNSFPSAWEGGTGQGSIVAKCNNIIEFFMKKSVKRFRCLLMDFNVDFLHHLDRQRVDIGGDDPPALSLPFSRTQIIQDTFCHLTPNGISSAEEKNLLYLGHSSLFWEGLGG